MTAASAVVLAFPSRSGDRPAPAGGGASVFPPGVLDHAIASFFTRDMRLANRAIEEVREAEALSEEIHTAALSLPAGPAVALGYVAESVRRLGEYSGDIAETVINHAVERKA